MLETVKDETVKRVFMIVEGLGFEEIHIRGLNSKFFLEFFKEVINMDDIDIDFLKSGLKISGK